MWPWEHLAAGYLLYSLGLRALGREPPSDGAVVALGVATLLPDLIDKPLSWGLGWVPTGYGIGHSIFLAIPLGVAVLVAGRRYDRSVWAVAFVVGYWSHLVTDVLNPLRYGASVLPGRVLWPVSDAEPYETDRGLGRGLVYLEEFLASLAAMPPMELLVVYLLVPAAGTVLWLLDGAPGVALATRTADGLWRHLQ